MQAKYIVIFGSLLSGIGKGIVSASISKILDMYGYDVMPLKFDGYLNYDCGTMNPYRHGEVFVLDDKSEVDMDFGNYERFLNKDLDTSSSITGGKLFSEIIAKERRGDYLGRDVQMVPNLTDLILEKVKSAASEKNAEIMIIEVGGTVGDIENSYFIEAMRQLALNESVVFVDVSFVPELESVGEQKTKPTQLAIKGLMQSGIQPHFIICRSSKPLTMQAKSKIALFSNLPPERIIDDHDIDTIYEVPAELMRQNLDKMIIEQLKLPKRELRKDEFDKWTSRVNALGSAQKAVSIAIVGKYMNLHDSYASVKEALVHSAMGHGAKLSINWVESEKLEGKSSTEIEKMLSGNSGMIVPGGFGKRGTEGMIKAIEYARNKKMPYLGICYGMQLMAIEYARNVCGIKDASSSEFDPECKDPVISIMETQKSIDRKGGTMRLGAWEAVLKEGTSAYSAYGQKNISERHRHRYELNNNYRDVLEKNGLIISGTTPDNELVELIEWPGSFGIGTQAHPELKSRPEHPAPLFMALLKSALDFGKTVNPAP